MRINKHLERKKNAVRRRNTGWSYLHDEGDYLGMDVEGKTGRNSATGTWASGVEKRNRKHLKQIFQVAKLGQAYIYAPWI